MTVTPLLTHHEQPALVNPSIKIKDMTRAFQKHLILHFIFVIQFTFHISY